MGEQDGAIGELKGRVDALEGWMEKIEDKVDRLLHLASMSQGGLWMLLKILGLIGLGAMALGWLSDHVEKLLK